MECLHGGYIYTRRGRVLSDHFAEVIPPHARVLDVGCGDGLLDHLIMQKRPDIDLHGNDVLVRDKTYIPVEGFDGQVIPYPVASFDVVMFIDVLHHMVDPLILLREAVRVADKALVIKDHTRTGFLAGPTLRLMDWFGNARHGVALPYNYWPQERWLEIFDTLGLTIDIWKQELSLYPRPANWLFERSLHFMARLNVSG